MAAIADALEVSTDYLLGRTDDPIDFAKGKKKQADSAPQKTATFQKAGNENLIQLISRLDPTDRLRAEGVIQGMLMQDKYLPGFLPNVAHIRTDVPVTPDMIAHDEDIMSDDDF